MPAGIESRATLPWLVRLRWLAIASQLLALLLYYYELDSEIPVALVASIVGIAAASNIALATWLRRHAAPARADLVTAALLTLDTLLLTGLLASTGGPANPFTIFYIVHIVLAALVLETRSTVWITLLSAVGFATLFLTPSDEHGAHDHQAHMAQLDGHLRGMWIAFAVAAAVIAYFVRKISLTIAAQREQIALLRERDASRARLASLAALSAGAAHELGTPLGTIAVAARELELALQRTAAPASTLADVQLIAEEVERCRMILGGMAAETTADDLRVGTAGAEDLFEAIRGRFDHDRASRIHCVARPKDAIIRCPIEGVARTAATLVKNAFDATAPSGGGAVEVELVTDNDAVVLTVRDDGPGMAPEILARAGEPFFTTKEPGSGMGLGLFLARTYAESLGGQLELRARSPRGTDAVLTLPFALRTEGAPA